MLQVVLELGVVIGSSSGELSSTYSRTTNERIKERRKARGFQAMYYADTSGMTEVLFAMKVAGIMHLK